MKDISIFDRFTKIDPIHKGWSSDKKYLATAADGQRYLLRVANIAEYEHKKVEFENMKRMAALGIPMQKPVEMGVCNTGQSVYLLLTWIDGEDAEDVLPLLPETEQYVRGLQAGQILKKMHTLSVAAPSDDWLNGYGMKIDRYIHNYQNCGYTFDGDTLLINYLQQNRHLMSNRPMCLTHDDYHPGNMILSADQKLSLIDFQRLRTVEPYHAFSGLCFSAKYSPRFATGQIHGYFDGEPPGDFWQLLALYMAAIAVNALPWSVPYGQREIDFAYKQIADIMIWYDNMKNPVPTWYLKDFYIQYIDGVPFKLKAPFDFSFLSKYGRVFKVFDDQDSGNICFGVQADDGKRYFVKFAGAPTEPYTGDTESAIERLKSAVPAYQDLAHPTLIHFVKADEIGGGLALVFEWVGAECMGRMYPLSRQKFMNMPLETKIQVLEDILGFHAYVHAQGYAAIDFYDGSVMYDLVNQRTIICDIDFYVKKPYQNHMADYGAVPVSCRPRNLRRARILMR